MGSEHMFSSVLPRQAVSEVLTMIFHTETQPQNTAAKTSPKVSCKLKSNVNYKYCFVHLLYKIKYFNPMTTDLCTVPYSFFCEFCYMQVAPHALRYQGVPSDHV